MGLGSGNTRLPVDGLTVELSLVSDVMLALSSDSMESAELMLHQRLISGLLPEPATVERTEHSLQLKVNALHSVRFWHISPQSLHYQNYTKPCY